MAGNKPRLFSEKDKEIMQRIGERIRARRVSSNVTPFRGGKVHPALWFPLDDIEAGKANPKFLTLYEICKFYGISMSELVKDIC